MPEGSGGAYSGIGMQIRVEFNLNPNEFVPPPPLSFPTPEKTVPCHPLGDGHQVTVPHPPPGGP